MSLDLDNIPIIDTDTHVVEPPDLWTSRVSAKWGDSVPHVVWDADAGEEVWVMGTDNRPIKPVASSAMAGWHEYPPKHPRTWSDASPMAWDAAQRLSVMDRLGIKAQVLYPNVALMNAGSFQDLQDSQFQLECIQAYNDFQIEWGSLAPDRFIAMTVLPMWDLKLSLAEVERCATMGHRGIVFSQNPGYFGLPPLTSRRWDPLWSSAQEKGLSINFHIATGDPHLGDQDNPENGIQANFVAMTLRFFLDNSNTITQLICGGICHRFPRLNFVSVESGVGWLPYTLETLDWQWKNSGVVDEHPEYDLLPSEYFRRQIYGCFWFEQDSAKSAIAQLGADNIMYETDFPHPTCMYPGPKSSAQLPRSYLRSSFSDLDAGTARKILHDNAAKLYHIV